MFEFLVLEPAMVWAQLAEVLDVDDLVALGDAIVTGSTNPDIRGSGPAASIQDLREALSAMRGHRGAENMARAIDLIRPGPLSRPESLLRVMAVRAGLPAPIPNQRVTDREGRLLWMPDLCWPEFRVLVEYQGDGHRTSSGKFRSDITRLEDYTDGGWLAMQASTMDVFRDPNPFLARVRRRLESQGWRSRRELRQIDSARP